LLDVETLTRKAEVPESLGMTLSLSLREPKRRFPARKGVAVRWRAADSEAGGGATHSSGCPEFGGDL
jgi:hypothetical protein